jgi:glycosyltransferase involved in cell wall biosynthesis
MALRVAQLRGSSLMLGAERVVLELSTFSRQFGCECIILAPHEEHATDPELVVAARNAGVRAERLACRGRFDPAVFGRIRDFVRREKIDLLHCHGYKEDFYGLLSLPRIPVIATYHNHLFNRTTRSLTIYSWLDAQLIRYFDHIVAVSSPIHEELLRNRVPHHKLSRITNGIDVRPFRDVSELDRQRVKESLNLPMDATVVGMVGSLTVEKGHIVAVQAFARMHADVPKAHLAIVGSGPQHSAVTDEIERHGLSDRVTLCGRRSDIPAVMQAFDVFAMPSLQEGLPIALLEAMASGLPVVASNVGDIGTAITDGLSGRLVPAGNVAALAETLKDVMLDRHLRERLGKAARTCVEGKFSSQHMAQDYCDLYERLAKMKYSGRVV